ncbi:MAG TPA: hypothetical protein VHE61_20235 [Opitutaceae bacterium]|nr:hypothetical protein [Opitutaceae bacterium]
MKKTTTKSSKSPAPAISSNKPAKKKISSASTPPAPLVAPAAPVPVAPQVAPAVKAGSVPVQTKIIARIDVGFGNALYVRGDGPSLTWNQGVPMTCVASDQWELVLGESSGAISFKVLLNDTTWCTGADSTVASGATVTVTPEFV